MSQILPSKGNKSFFSLSRKSLSRIWLFFILFFLPVVTIWVAFSNIQKNITKIEQDKKLDELSEMTSHMLRLTEPESYYQESVRRLAESFKWAESLEDVNRFANKEVLELALFDEKGNRIKWPVNENLVKTRISQEYLKALKRLSQFPGTSPTNEENDIATKYSGNSMTLTSISASQNNLINFQGIGLRKMGGWFRVKFKSDIESESQIGDLIAWLNLDKLDKYSLADKTIDTMTKFTDSSYTFSYIDLNNIEFNKSSRGRKLKKNVTKILSANALKSNFIYENELFSINDTKEGIRLICSCHNLNEISLMKNFIRLLLIFIPVSVLLFFWKIIFKIDFNFSIKTIAAFIYGYSSIIGIIALLISTIAYQYEKKETVIQKYKNEAIEILEKVDQQYTDSFDDLLFQYRHFNEELSNTNKSPSEVLAPLLKAQKEDIIAYAVYVNEYGKVVFQAPESIGTNNSAKIADRYCNVVNRIAIQCLTTFNSSRSKSSLEKVSAPIQIITANAVEALLSGRSNFIETKLDNEETLAFMDFTTTKDDYANGCLLVVHEPQKLEKHYLQEKGKNLSNAKEFELIAFPKTSSNIKAYYPRYSFIFEEPLWKLNDMVNQKQLPSFKNGKVGEENVIVAAIPANKMKNYNLFLLMPLNNLGDKSFSLSNVLLFGTIFSLFIIFFISILIGQSLSYPIKTLIQNAELLKKKILDKEVVNYPDSRELECIDLGINNLIIKTNEIRNTPNFTIKLLPFKSINLNGYDIKTTDEFISENNLFYYASSIGNDILFAFLIKANKIDSSISLTMAGMAVKSFIEFNRIKSPLVCIQNLDDFFKINYKRNIDASIVVAFLDTKINKLNYSCMGDDIALLQSNSNGSNFEIVNLNITNSIDSLRKIGDCEMDFESNTCFALLSNLISKDDLNNMDLQELKKDEFDKYLENNLKEITLKTNSKAIYFLRHSIQEDIQSSNKKLAESNPIAFIRSQKTRISTNA